MEEEEEEEEKLNLGAGGGRDFIDRILEVNQHVLRGKCLMMKLEP